MERILIVLVVLAIQVALRAWVQLLLAQAV
jgi:hypothetical protein